MRFFAVFILICLLLTGSVAAKAADAVGPGVTRVNTDIGTGIYTPSGYTACSDDSASVGTPVEMGELDVDSIPDGASIAIDGSPWSYKHCFGSWPAMSCVNLPLQTPYKGNLETGTHSITISLSGYKSYTGTVKICSEKVSYVHKPLTAEPATTTTPPTTTTATTTTATTTTSAATTATTATVTTSATTSAGAATTTVAGTAITAAASVPAMPPGTGSLSITTAPAGAAVYIDGVQRGVSPAVIPGLAAGSHTVLLKLDGYQDLSTPVTITSGTANAFSTGLIPLAAGAAAVPATTPAGTPPAAATKAQSPGFGAALSLSALGAILYLRNGSRR